MATHLLDYADADTFTRDTEATGAFVDPRTGKWHWVAPGEPHIFSDGAIVVGLTDRVPLDE